MRKPATICALFLAIACTASAGLNDVSESLNNTIKVANLPKILPKLSETLALDRSVVEKALVETKLKLSDIVIAKFISEKINAPIKDLLTTSVAANWLEQLKKNQLSEQDAEEYLDTLQTDVAVMMIDFWEKQRR
jgi:hypothetical protein